MKNYLFGLLVLVFLFPGCAGQTPSPTGEVQRIVILHTNDIHGHAWPHGKPLAGGYAAQKFLIDNIRREEEAKGIPVFVLSAGDVNTGVPESNLLLAEPDFKAMDAIGYDAMALGNHEFDNGPELILKQKTWVRFPFLSANISLRNSRKKLAEPFTILRRQGVRIGVLGLTADDIADLASPKDAEKLSVEDAIESARKWVPEIQKKGVDFIIALTHMGVNYTGRDKNRSLFNDDTKLAAAGLPIPLIIGGHSHTVLPEGLRSGQTLITQAGEKGQFLGRVDLVWDKTHSSLAQSTARLIPIDPAQGTDAALEESLSAHKAKFEKKLSQVIGETAVDLDADKDSIRYRETAFGNLIADIVREKTKADVAVFNSGGIRYSIPKGPVTLRQIDLALPYRNTIVSGHLTGAQLRLALEEGVDKGKKGSRFLQVSGLSFEIHPDASVRNILVQGKPLEETKTYRVATNDFVMAGGDHLNAFLQAKDVVDTGIPVDVQVIQYFKTHRRLAPKVEGRIRQIP